MPCKRIAIVGLGLIGGSLLKALQGFQNAEFYGIDIDSRVISEARAQGLISGENLSDAQMLAAAEVVFVCLPPEATVAFVNSSRFKPGALVTDVCGVKQMVLNSIANREIDFIGGHPMAGKEESGFFASDANLFRGAAYLLTPRPENSPAHLDLLRQMIDYIGCRQTVITTPEEHDDMIAYTSQLMHVVAVALCDSRRLDKAKNFSAGSLRDCTRVAKLDSRLWSRLFLHNKSALLACMEEFEASLATLKQYLAAEDEAGLEAFLRQCSDRKKQFFKEK